MRCARRGYTTMTAYIFTLKGLPTMIPIPTMIPMRDTGTIPDEPWWPSILVNQKLCRLIQPLHQRTHLHHIATNEQSNHTSQIVLRAGRFGIELEVVIRLLNIKESCSSLTLNSSKHIKSMHFWRCRDVFVNMYTSLALAS